MADITPSATPTIGTYLSTYTERRTLAHRSRAALRTAVASFSSLFGDLPVDQIDSIALNRWIENLEHSCSPRSVITYRSGVLSILRMAADDGVCVEPNTRKIRRPRKPRPLPRAWTDDQLRRVVQVCENLPGQLRPPRSCPACVYFTALVRIAYETGLRRGNLFSLQQSEVRDDGTVYVRHEKTGEPHVCQLDPGTVALLRQLPGTYPLRWRNSNTYGRWWKRIYTAANVPRGGCQMVRKTAATLVWLQDPGNPSRVQRFLGHLCPDMWRHYVDLSQSPLRPAKPPRLELPDLRDCSATSERLPT